MILGIGGATRAGKTTLAHDLKSRNQDLAMVIISQDDYVFPIHQIPKIKNEMNWECPESINIEKFLTAIRSANDIYDITIVEGLLVFYFNELHNIFDKKIFIEIDKSTFLKRKKNDLRWGKIPEWYKEHIWNSYLKYGTINKQTENLYYINGTTTISIKPIEHFLNFSELIHNRND